jgi:hypothetical protein
MYTGFPVGLVGSGFPVLSALFTVSITVKVVRSNPAHGEVYSIQHRMLNVYQRLVTDWWFSSGKHFILY